MTQRGTRLSAEDWADAALEALGRGGLAAVAVEPLATRLDTTKGSFYWHFRNRDALIEAALLRWEERGTTQVIADIETDPDPVAKLRRLFATVIGHGLTHRIELSLLASADHPAVGPVLRRIGERRVAYVAQLFGEVGFEAAEAHRRALIGVSVYLGNTQLASTAPSVLPATDAERLALISSTVDALLAGAPGPF
ncbi:TetR/AcrR family transcriptional regulator [Phytomonospora sp. NPDC050363]|uniref:TetR/AcrR family transcriptional regulator n=1 Tax=Phytomonospora sp. NPDC050363 TaxID=3155642 RepID=UPI0033DE6237